MNINTTVHSQYKTEDGRVHFEQERDIARSIGKEDVQT